jgi:hypothetical protein
MTFRALTVSVLLLALIAGCETFDPAPSAALDGVLDGGMSTTPDQPLLVRFAEPIVPSSLRLRIVRDVRDAEGNLLDEQRPPDHAGFETSTLARYDGPATSDPRATFALGSDNRTLTIQTTEPLPSLEPLLLVIEPGLEDFEGHATKRRILIEFEFSL